MQNIFVEEMARRTDAELIAIVTSDKNDYMPAALAVAEEEVHRRGLSHEQIELYRTKSADNRRQKDQRAEKSLSFGLKAFGFFMPFTAFPLLIIMGFMVSKGYKRKSREFAFWILCGMSFYVAVGLLMVIA